MTVPRLPLRAASARVLCAFAAIVAVCALVVGVLTTPARADEGGPRGAVGVSRYAPTSTVRTSDSQLNTRRPNASQPNATRPIVVIGVGGLRADMITEAGTPNLFRFVRGAAVGNVVVKTVAATTCPADGWLMLNAGARILDPASRGSCADVATVLGRWPGIVAEAATNRYEPALGSLAHAFPSAVAVGPGAQIALVGAHGQAPRSVSSIGDVPPGTGLVVVDAGAITRTDDPRPSWFSPFARGVRLTTAEREQASAIDGRIGGILAQVRANPALGEQAIVVVTSVGDSNRSIPMLQFIGVAGPGVPPGYVGTIRVPAVAVLSDLTPILADKPNVLGLHFDPDGASATARLDRLVEVADQGFVTRAAIPLWWASLLLAAGSICLIGVVRARRGRGGSDLAASPASRASHPAPTLNLPFLIATLATLSLPAATMLAVPTMGLGAVGTLIVSWILAAAIAVAVLIALAVTRAPRSLAPVLVSGLTAVVILADVLLGSPMSRNAILGSPFQMGWRFYGMSNGAFAILAMTLFFALAHAGSGLVRRGHRGSAIAVVILLGAATAFVDSSAKFGADFGGLLALIIGTAALALLLSGRTLSPRRVGIVVAVAVPLTLLSAWIDYLRPAQSRTHLGNFFAKIVDGGAWPVVVRKLESFTGGLHWALSLAVLVTLVALVALAAARIPWQRLDLWKVDGVRRAVMTQFICVIPAFLLNDSPYAIVIFAVVIMALQWIASAEARRAGEVSSSRR